MKKTKITLKDRKYVVTRYPKNNNIFTSIHAFDVAVLQIISRKHIGRYQGAISDYMREQIDNVVVYKIDEESKPYSYKQSFSYNHQSPGSKHEPLDDHN